MQPKPISINICTAEETISIAVLEQIKRQGEFYLKIDGRLPASINSNNLSFDITKLFNRFKVMAGLDPIKYKTVKFGIISASLGFIEMKYSLEVGPGDSFLRIKLVNV